MTTITDVKQRELLGIWLNDEARLLPYNRGVGAHAVVFVVDKDSEPDPPAPAWYVPLTGNAYIHLDAADIDLAEAVVTGSKDQAKAHGLLAHEAAHSRWSDWLMRPETRKAFTAAQYNVATMFEEMRVESKALNSKPDLRNSLRASLGIIISHAGEDLPTTRYEIARLWALIFGRSITTVVEDDEVKWVDVAARTVLGDDDVDYLTDLLQEALEVRAENKSRMVTLCQEWLNVVGEPEHPEEDGGGCGHGGEKAEGEGSGKSSGDEKGDEGADDGDGDSEKGEDLSSSAGVANSVDGPMADDDETEYSPPVGEDEGELLKDMLERTLEEIAANWDNAPVSMANAEEMARKVFGVKKSRRLAESAPTAYHQRHVAETAKVLENFSIPAISKVTVAAALPPGRLRTREAIRASAERAQGRMVTARPWEATKRRHTHTRPIVVGIATDTSSSMRWAEASVADFAYTWANAGVRVGARTAAVTFGDAAIAVSGPGEILSVVRRKSADGGTEVADQALAALDGGLKLSHQNGAAKLLVVVSDGHLVIRDEWLRVVQRLKDFRAGGTKTIWVTPSSGNTFISHLKKTGLAEVVTLDKVDRYSYYSDGEDGKTFDLIQAAVLAKLRTMSNN